MRGYRNYTNYKPAISIEDRVVSGLSFLSYGLIGFIWIIVSHIRGKSLSSFARFHIFQSIMFFIGVYVITLILNIFLGFVQIMPFIGSIVANIVYYTSEYPLVLDLPLTTFLVQAVAVYMAVFSFLGKYAELPKLSDYVRQMV